MRGKFARIEALSPRPEGAYRLAVRMKSSVPMSVTMEALGTWGVFDITTDWELYSLLIAEPAGDYIDLYPLSDDTLYLEDMQLTYGKDAYDWRPAPEDDVTYDWTCVSVDEATIANIRDIVSYTEYSCLVDAGDPAPSAPTTNPPPAPWVQSGALDGAYQATTRTTGSISGASVNALLFAHAVEEPGGLYRFIYDGASWVLDGNVIRLSDYGVGVTGSPTGGDTIAVELRLSADKAMYRCAVTLYSDGSFSWGDVTLSDTYNAIRAALNTSTNYQTRVQQLLDSWDVSVRMAEVDNETHETVADMMGRIQVTESTISNLIDVMQKGDDGLNERISSLQTQTSREIRNTFTEAKEYADEQYGVARDYVTTAQTWQRFSADGIEQGKLGSPFKSRLNNEELGFYENEQKVAYISNHKFMITVGEVEDSLMIGNFEFTSSENGLGIIYGRRG